MVEVGNVEEVIGGKIVVSESQTVLEIVIF